MSATEPSSVAGGAHGARPAAARAPIPPGVRAIVPAAGLALSLVSGLVGAVLPGPLAAALTARAWAAETEDDPEVVFYSPAAHRPSGGETEIEVEVWAEGVEEVVFRVDGSEVGRLGEPPWRLVVELDEELGAHLFEVIALGAGGEIVRGELETPALRIDETVRLELQQLYVTLESGDAEAPALELTDFDVRDDGVRQRIVTFERGDAALAVALLVDASESMRGGRLAAALEGARTFLRGMRDLDEAVLYLFADSLRYRSPPTQDAAALQADLAAVEAVGGTALNDALYAALRQLEFRQGRRVVVLLSDGVDLHSALRMEDVLWTMRRCGSVVYWIELVRNASVSSPWRDAAAHRREREGLRRLVEQSGGRIVPIESTDQAAGAFADILDELRRQYVLGYYPTVNRDDGRWHDVRVRVEGRRVKLRTRGGYVDY